MGRKTITERVLEALAEEPMHPLELAEKLGLTERQTSLTALGIKQYYWGRWSFADAEDRGLIEWKDEKWHLVEEE